MITLAYRILLVSVNLSYERKWVRNRQGTIAFSNGTTCESLPCLHLLFRSTPLPLLHSSLNLLKTLLSLPADTLRAPLVDMPPLSVHLDYHQCCLWRIAENCGEPKIRHKNMADGGIENCGSMADKQKHYLYSQKTVIAPKNKKS